MSNWGSWSRWSKLFISICIQCCSLMGPQPTGWFKSVCVFSVKWPTGIAITMVNHYNSTQEFQGHSTETALVRVQNDAICAVGQQKAVLLVLLDLSAAFDTVNHQLLIKTLQQLGIRGTMLHWFSTYLVGRLQRNKVNGVTSQPKLLDCGVPQGSVLGPILFTIYTASLGQLLRQLDVQYHFYADDSQLWVIFKPPELDTAIGQMEKCIASVQKWMLSHQRKMNDDKTEFLVISSKSIARGIGSPSLHIGDHQVVQRQEHRCDDGLQSINGGPRAISLQVVLYPHSQPE